ncbi:MAG: pyrroline-5-carboxylate reductase [Flavobacteriaceae bacterium]|nr:pyrroline-5-carboxylate reductase [Flavobacteriaceae bacterium]
MSKLLEQKIAIIGCGNLGKSILEGLLKVEGIKASNLTATRRNIESLDKFAHQGVKVTSNNVEAIAGANIIVLGLKPHHILIELEKLKEEIQENQIIISLATGISLDDLQNASGKPAIIFRAMPNTATTVAESLTCICSNSEATEKTHLVEELFNKLGSTVVIHENLMEAATVLGACGIAFVLRFIRGMIQGGIQIGFDAKTAGIIVNQTVKGASQLLIQNGEHPEFEIDKVTTPRGCTISGLNEMEHNGFSSALIKGIVASFDKIEK